MLVEVGGANSIAICYSIHKVQRYIHPKMLYCKCIPLGYGSLVIQMTAYNTGSYSYMKEEGRSTKI